MGFCPSPLNGLRVRGANLRQTLFLPEALDNKRKAGLSSGQSMRTNLSRCGAANHAFSHTQNIAFLHRQRRYNTKFPCPNQSPELVTCAKTTIFGLISRFRPFPRKMKEAGLSSGPMRTKSFTSAAPRTTPFHTHRTPRFCTVDVAKIATSRIPTSHQNW